MQAFLTNFTKIQAKWANSFKKENTTDEDFHVSKNKTIKVPMMKQRAQLRFDYSDELNAEVKLLTFHLFYNLQNISICKQFLYCT